MTPGSLRALADRYDAEGLKALETGDKKAALEAFSRAELARETAAEMDRRGALTTKTSKRSVVKSMTPDHKAALSRSRGGGESEPMRYARAAGMPSLRSIAIAMGVDVGFISRVFRGENAMPDARAEQFEALTKYPAGRWKKIQ